MPLRVWARAKGEVRQHYAGIGASGRPSPRPLPACWRARRGRDARREGEALRCREGELAGGVEGEVEGDFAVVAAGELEGGDLERALDGAEVRNDHLPVADGAGEDILAHKRVGGGILEDAGARHLRALDAGAGEQLAPLPGR